ncbi:MAG: AAA family ATPase [Candidatus Heimdallarchaeaceae archaeon]
MEKVHITDRKIAIILRGVTGVGKTTIAKLLVKRFYRSVHIETDVIRYMVVNGLVASRTGLPPGRYPEEYRRQCRLGDKNTIDLVRNFTNAGFIVVVDGFNGGESGDTFYYLEHPDEIKWYPDGKLLDRELPDVKTYQVVLDVSEEVLVKRLKNIKCWDKETIVFILNQKQIFMDTLKSGKIDLIVDTSYENPKKIANEILEKLEL